MSTARADHAAVLLDDGRVLVVGGRGSDGAIAAAEIYLAGSWMPAGGLHDARWGHTATLMKNGRVLVAGGENALGNLASVEVFDPATGAWSVAGSLASPRTGHAVAALTDGRVLIAGGFDGTQVLSSIEEFDSASGALNLLPVSLGVARAGLSATRLLNGSILFFGGNNGFADLASGEFLDPEASIISATPSAVVARRDHQAFLLPNNNAVLIVGGVTTAGGTASAELYLPWLNQFWATGAMGALRQDATGSALSLESYGPPSTSDGLLVVAGGQGLSSTDVYGFATIKTDRDDYVPGMAVNVSGGGWQPNETVTLGLRELPAEHETRSFAFQADEHGNIPSSQLFVVEQHHFGVQFYLTARGAASQAQVTFADARLWTLTITPTTTQTSATHT
ncbi:MAG: Kelch repeat-containing protein, partial [Longimicrobiales bacterium]